jgi:NTE family protein
MKRGLVLGGGGVVGVAWESGLVAGLRDGGVDLSAIDFVVGTSAGALVGSQLARGIVPVPTSDLSPGETGLSLRAMVASLPGGSLLHPTKVDARALGAAFGLWAKMDVTTKELAASIGAVARDVHRDGEARWVAEIGQSFAQGGWPERPLLVTAVDVASGERRVFDRDSGVDLSQALAASCAVPALFPSVTIDGKLYMDGQVQSSTNADALLAHAPLEVWIAMPTNARTAPGIGAHAERMLALEIAALREAGCAVHVTTPGDLEATRMGTNLMDASRVFDAYDVGAEAGRAWARQVG